MAELEREPPPTFLTTWLLSLSLKENQILLLSQLLRVNLFNKKESSLKPTPSERIPNMTTTGLKSDKPNPIGRPTTLKIRLLLISL